VPPGGQSERAGDLVCVLRRRPDTRLHFSVVLDRVAYRDVYEELKRELLDLLAAEGVVRRLAPGDPVGRNIAVVLASRRELTAALDDRSSN
jgi:hypothetical protein